MISIKKSKTLKHRSVVKAILENFPTLDPMAVLMNSDLYYIAEGNNIVAFSTLKKIGNSNELGTVYTHERYRGRGYAGMIIQRIISKNRKVNVFCEDALNGFYEKQGFAKCTKCHPVTYLRKRLFNFFLRPFFGYRINSLQAA